MHKFLKINGLFFCFCWIQLLSLYAQDDPCIRFEDLPADAVYGRDANQSPGDLAFSLKGVDAYLEEFIYSNTNETGFWNVSVNEDIFGQQQAVDGQSLFISNINLRFDFKNLEQPVNGLCFRIVDGGGEENIAVNGQPILVIPDFSDVPEEIAPGVFMSVNPLPDPNGNSIFNAEICLRGPIEELLIGGQEFAFDNLCFFHEPCTLSDLKAEVVNCDFVNDDVYVYEVAVDFSLPSTSNVPVSFDLFINNTFRGYFNTADLPLRMEQIRVLADQEVFDVTVCVNDRPDCCISLDLPNAGCPEDCNIEQVEIGEIECSFDGYYRTKIFTKGTNLSGSLKITNEAGETWFGPADGSELVKFPIPDQNYDKWIVCDPQYPNCCFTLDFDVPCPTCRIGPLQAEASECTDDGMFFIKLDFDHFTPTGQFYVFINDEEYSAHSYNSLPLRLGPFPADGITGYKVLVRDASEQCDQDIYLEPVTCPPYNCEIGALKVSERECTASGEFYFKLDFDHARTSEKFQLLLNQDVYESYAYADLPVKVGPLPADGTTDWHLLVKDLEGPCASEGKLEAVDCEPADCEIGPLHLSGPVCNDNGAFYFKLDFKYQNTSEQFQVMLNGEVFESYAYTDLPVRVGPLPADGTTDWQILVRDQYQHCASDAKIEAVSCEPQQCEIGDLRISGPICTPGTNNEFYLKLDFDYWNTSEKFELRINEETYETYAYADLPIKLGPFTADANAIQWGIRVVDVSEKCEQYSVVSGEVCNTEQCEIGELDISGPVCLDDGQFYFKLDFKYQNVSENFQLILNDEVFGNFSYADLPMRVGPLPADASTDWWVIVKDASQNCGREAKLPPVICYPDECAIGHLQVSEPQCTDASGEFFFKLDFEHKNNTDAFKLYLNGELYEQYPYQELPVTVGPLPADGTTDWHILVEDLSGLCAEDTKLEAVNCNPKTCEIGELKLSEAICTEDGQFFFEMNFDHANTTDKFILYLNGEKYESYAYGSLPVKVGPLPTGISNDWHVLVRDAGSNNIEYCASDAHLKVECPGGDCKIGELKLIETYCTDDGQEFYTHLNFQHEGTSEKFDLYLNDEHYGSFAYGELPLKLGPFNALIDLEWKLLVKDASGNCAEDIHFSAPNCGGGDECNLSNLVVERYPCIGGQFLVDLAFDIKDPGAEGYYVFTNGQINGPYSYDQAFITLGPFVGDGSTVYDFLVIDIADPSCYGYYELGPVDCSNPCTISDVFAEAHACNDDGGFMVDVSFNYDKVGGSGFSILANGETFGPFEYGEKYYTFGPLDGDGTTVYEIVVVDNDHPDCRDFTTLDAIDCLPCNIGALEYTVECLQNSKQFILNLDFEHENPDSEQFILAIGDQVVGSFFYADLPLSQELELPASGELIVAVWDSENESCAQKAEFSIPCCYLSELIVEAYPCENDGELWIDLDLDHYNVSSSFQLVYGPTGGELQVKEYTYSDLPITLGPLPGQASSEWYFEVTDLGFFCQSSTELSVDYCDNDACAEWEETTHGAYGPLTGYEPGDLIDEEDGLRLAFAPDNADNCNCSVFITKASTFPAFQAGNGQVVMLDNSGALIGAPGYEIQSLVVDYYFTGNEALLRVNGEPIIAAAHPLDLPEDIAPGVKLQVEPTSNDGRNGRMIFSGTIYRLSLLARGKWVLDNFCTEKTEKEDEVWPGDTNLDNIANHIDLLNIGLAYGEEGPARTNTNISWEAQQAADWPSFFFDKDLNYKHADANGDGRIDRTDRAPIMEHYGLTHGPLPVFNDVPATDNDPPLYVDFTASPNPIPTGGTFQVPIIFGTENQPVNDIYGIAFTITFDPAVIDPASIEVVYPDSWLGDTETDLLTLDRTLQDIGRIDVALTRIDKINVGGFGTIASLIGAIDDIAGKETTVGISEVVAITAAEDRVPVNGKEVIVEFSDELKPETGYIDLNASLNIFPNPTSSEVLITTRFNYPIERIRVLDGYGNPTGLHVEGKNRINLQELPSGVYMLRIQLGDYTISRKVIKVN